MTRDLAIYTDLECTLWVSYNSALLLLLTFENLDMFVPVCIEQLIQIS